MKTARTHVGDESNKQEAKKRHTQNTNKSSERIGRNKTKVHAKNPKENTNKLKADRKKGRTHTQN